LIFAIADRMDFDTPPPRLLNTNLTQRVLTVFFAVYNELGTGFPEFVYRRAMVLALKAAGMLVQEDTALPVWFRGERLATFRADLLLDSLVLVEVKAAPELDDGHRVQVLNYLKASDIEIGLLLNFGMSADFKRLVCDNVRKRRQRDPEDAPGVVPPVSVLRSS
jgi:GxxExxY protein